MQSGHQAKVYDVQGAFSISRCTRRIRYHYSCACILFHAVFYNAPVCSICCIHTQSDQKHTSAGDFCLSEICTKAAAFSLSVPAELFRVHEAVHYKIRSDQRRKQGL